MVSLLDLINLKVSFFLCSLEISGLMRVKFINLSLCLISMKKFDRVDIDMWRAEFVNRRYLHQVACLEDREVDFFVLPDSLFEGIPNGLFRMTGDKKDGYLIGVSWQVPEVVQPYFAISEHDEFMVYGLDDLDRTLHSEQNMIGLLEHCMPLARAYAKEKLVLYDHMLGCSKEALGELGFTPEDRAGLERAASFLRG